MIQVINLLNYIILKKYKNVPGICSRKVLKTVRVFKNCLSSTTISAKSPWVLFRG